MKNEIDDIQRSILKDAHPLDQEKKKKKKKIKKNKQPILSEKSQEGIRIMMLKHGFCSESGLQVLPKDEKEIERQLCEGLDHINKSPIV